MKNEDKEMLTTTYSICDQDPLHADIKDEAGKAPPCFLPGAGRATLMLKQHVHAAADWQLP